MKDLLVRDDFARPTLPRDDKGTPPRVARSDHEFLGLLVGRLSWDIKRYAHAPTKADKLIHMGDMLGLLVALAEFHGFSQEELLRSAEMQEAEGGGFSKRLFVQIEE